MAECHVVINEVPPTDDDAGVAGSGSDRSVGMAGVEWADSTAQFKAPNGAVAEAGVPTTVSQGDLRPMIEGRLMEADRDPLRTQVVLREVGQGTHISLQDEFQEIDTSPQLV